MDGKKLESSIQAVLAAGSGIVSSREYLRTNRQPGGNFGKTLEPS